MIVPSFPQPLAIVLFGVGVLLIVGGGVILIRPLLSRGWPFSRFVPLRKAAEYAYGHLHGSMIVDVAETPILGPAEPLGYIVTHMTQTLHLPLYGYKPYTKKLEEIREEHLRWCSITNDLTTLEERDGNTKRLVYSGLQMRMSDVRKYVREQKGREWPAIS